MSSLLKNILLAFVLAVIVGLGYVLFFRKSDSETLTASTQGGTAGAVTLENQVLLNRLTDLQKMKINGTIFNDPRFVSLQNFRKELIDEPTGRDNPFSPVQ